jgi:site-specific DNA-cytosine methylase
MLLLELFKGTGSVGKVAKKLGYDVISLDMDEKFKPDILTDILKWTPPKELIGLVDVIWASPPCTEYSIAKTTGTRDYALADSIVKKTFSIINKIKPKWWFIENPRGHLKDREFMKKYDKYKYLVTYCSYDSSFPPKPTNIWTNCPNWDIRYETKDNPCKNTKINPDTGRRIHTTTIADKTKLCDRYRIPSRLIKTLLDCTMK